MTKNALGAHHRKDTRLQDFPRRCDGQGVNHLEALAGRGTLPALRLGVRPVSDPAEEREAESGFGTHANECLASSASHPQIVGRRLHYRGLVA